MRGWAWILCIMAVTVVFAGCETVKGAGKGLQQDAKNTWHAVHDDTGWVKKSDNWIKEKMW